MNEKIIISITIGSEKCIPKGTHIFISIKDLHRDEMLWNDPIKFRPERFAPQEVKERHPLAFLPFANGPRNCIGNIDTFCK